MQAVRCIDKDGCRLCLEAQPDGSLTPLLDPASGTNIGVEGGTCEQGQLLDEGSNMQVELPDGGSVDVEFTTIIGEPSTFGEGSCPVLYRDAVGNLSGYCTCLGTFDDAPTSPTFALFVQRDPVTPTLCGCVNAATNPGQCANNPALPGCSPLNPVCPVN